MRLTLAAQVCVSIPIQLQRTEAVHLKHKMRLTLASVVLATVSTALLATSSHDTTNAAANPIRKVVTMLQSIQKKFAAEGEREKQLFDKYSCWCRSGAGKLAESITGATAKVPQVQSDIEGGEGQLAQLKADLKQHQSDRDAAKASSAEATAIREKEAAAFAAEKAEYDANIDALSGAIAAISKGMVGGFLQSSAAQRLRAAVVSTRHLLDGERMQLASFLSGSEGSGYAPQSGEILGMLKQLKDSMSQSLGDATASEKAAIKGYEELVDAKAKEVSALTKAIEEKTVRSGELGVAIVQMEEDLSDTEKALAEDKAFLADMDKSCALKKEEYDAHVKVRSGELVALAETIKVLNDDESLELFKKTLPSASSSLVQLHSDISSQRAQAWAKVREAQRKYGRSRPELDFLALAIQGKKVSFDKVTVMIDGMIEVLGREQQDDDHKKEYCGKQFDFADDMKKGLEHDISDLERAIAQEEDGVAVLTDEIGSLRDGIEALDKEVTEATTQRREEHEAYTELIASNSAAKEVLGFAKNRLNKFYNPSLYLAPPKRKVSEEQRITLNLGGTLAPTNAPGGIAGTGITVLAQVNAHMHHKDAPPPPPETFGAYAKKSGHATGVIEMIDLLIKNLDKEITEAGTEEKDAQADYEQSMKDSAAKRSDDSQTLANKEAAKAAMEGDLETHKEQKIATTKELMATLKYVQSLHAECDWLIQYFDIRKEARAGELDSLRQAKAVLSGADFSLVQLQTRGFLARPHQKM